MRMIILHCDKDCGSHHSYCLIAIAGCSDTKPFCGYVTHNGCESTPRHHVPLDITWGIVQEEINISDISNMKKISSCCVIMFRFCEIHSPDSLCTILQSACHVYSDCNIRNIRNFDFTFINKQRDK